MEKNKLLRIDNVGIVENPLMTQSLSSRRLA